MSIVPWQQPERCCESVMQWERLNTLWEVGGIGFGKLWPQSVWMIDCGHHLHHPAIINRFMSLLNLAASSMIYRKKGRLIHNLNNLFAMRCCFSEWIIFFSQESWGHQWYHLVKSPWWIDGSTLRSLRPFAIAVAGALFWFLDRKLSFQTINWSHKTNSSDTKS